MERGQATLPYLKPAKVRGCLEQLAAKISPPFHLLESSHSSTCGVRKFDAQLILFGYRFISWRVGAFRGSVIRSNE
jgi:hypothetical protein